MARTEFAAATLSLISSVSWASSSSSLMWRHVEFENEGGARVALEMRDDVLVRATVVLEGRRTSLPESLLVDVKSPVLRSADLVYSSSIVGNRSETTVSLLVPVLVDDVEKQGSSPSRRYQYVFRDDRFVERVLEERIGTLWRSVEVENFDRSNRRGR